MAILDLGPNTRRNGFDVEGHTQADRTLRGRVRGVVALAALLVAFALAPSADAVGQAPPPAPTVTGPVTLGTRGQPWGRAVPALAPLDDAGFVEEEYFISGDAAGRDEAAVPTGASAPYTTRVLVARPGAASDFNGVVVVEWLNVSTQMDLPIMFGMTRAEILREGYAYVGVSAQAAGVSGGPTALKGWDPVRYASLLHPGDAYAHDIFSHALQAVRASTGVRPLADLVPDVVLAVGESQSCVLLGQYANVVQREHQLADGFLLHTCATPIRDDIGRPTILLTSESEIDGFTGPRDQGLSVPVVADVPGLGIVRVLAPQGAPPEVDGPRYRVWEVAGGSHYDDQSMDYLVALMGDGLSAPAGGGPVPFVRQGCDGFPFNRLAIERPTTAALHHLATWAAGGPAAPSFPRVARTSGGAIARDADGLALDGLRLPPMQVPIGVNIGDDCPFIGSYQAFTAEKVHARCPSRQAYLTAVGAAVARSVDEGALLEPEGRAYIAEAELAAADIWAEAETEGSAGTCALGLEPTTTAIGPQPAPDGSGSGPDEAESTSLPATGGGASPTWVIVAAMGAFALRRLTRGGSGAHR